MNARIRRVPDIAFCLVAALLLSAAVAHGQARKPNIVIIWGDDIGQSNISAYSHGLMATRRPTSTASRRKG